LGLRLPGSLAVFEILSEQCCRLCERARSDAENTFNDACFATDVASAEMVRKYQRRRDRFRTNLTKASGL